MTTVITYTSQDASAPVLTGQTGSLVALLKACLVSGYGSKSAAGWTEPFTSSTTQAAFRNDTTAGTGFYLYVDDTGGGAGGAREAFMTGFQAMTAINAGTGQFPTSAQLTLGTIISGAVVARKSTTADATARKWTVIADNTVFYLFTETGDSVNPTTPLGFMFGDFFSYASSDPYRCMITGNNLANSGSNQTWLAVVNGVVNSNTLLSTLPGTFIAANFNGIGGSALAGKTQDQTKTGNSNGSGSSSGTTGVSASGATTLGAGANASIINLFPYPNPPDGGLYLSPVWVHNTGVLRGYLKGFWAPLANIPLGHNDTVSGSGSLAGKSFICQRVQANNAIGAGSCILQETSSTWS